LNVALRREGSGSYFSIGLYNSNDLLIYTEMNPHDLANSAYAVALLGFDSQNTLDPGISYSQSMSIYVLIFSTFFHRHSISWCP
jgi:hypothetical protein